MFSCKVSAARWLPTQTETCRSIIAFARPEERSGSGRPERRGYRDDYRDSSRRDGGPRERPRGRSGPPLLTPRRGPPRPFRTPPDNDSYDGEGDAVQDVDRSRMEPVDPFDAMIGRLQGQLQEGLVIRKESWEKLLGRVRTPRQAAATLDLILSDAKCRDATSWEWATHGYGQTAFQLVQAAAEAGAPHVAEQLLASREALHLTLNKDLVPTLMRKVGAATADGRTDDIDEHVEVVRRLYGQEVVLRGSNSPEAAYELSRVLRRAEDVDGVRSLYEQILREGLALRDRLLEDVERWLAKRGVRV